MKALIFNSGLGCRMGELTSEKPKCMVTLYNGETIFDRQIRILSECGIREFIVTTGYCKEQIMDAAKKYDELKFIFVENKEYESTNYIVSMNHATEYLDDDMLILHGDLVFNKKLVDKVIKSEKDSVCVFHEDKTLPEKDFKGRFSGNLLKEVSISIFDDDCYAFQPFYKLSKEVVTVWKDKVEEFVKNGQVKVYAENALNQVTNQVEIYGMSYKDDYVDEIDNREDYIRVSEEIQYFDYREQETVYTNSYLRYLKGNLKKSDKVFLVCSKRMEKEIVRELGEFQITVFSGYSANPSYEEVQAAVEKFKEKNYNIIVSVSGGSGIDVAKCIKLFSVLEKEEDFLKKKYVYSKLKHIAIPTTAGTGSESTQIAVIYYQGEKYSVEHGSILPEVAVLDGNLLTSLPDYQKKSTLLDALCQGIESYWSKRANKESMEYAKECIRLILENYSGYLKGDLEAGEKILLAANYSGRAINISRTTAAHAMSYKLTSMYGIPHGHAVAVCLIPVWKMLKEKAENIEKLRSRLLGLAELFGCTEIEEAIERVENIMLEIELPKVKIVSDDIKVLAESVNTERLKNNPVIFSGDELAELYHISGLNCYYKMTEVPGTSGFSHNYRV